MTDKPPNIKVAILESQIERLISDMESEKGTRVRANQTLHTRLDQIEANQRKLERIIYMGLGGLAVLQYLLTLPK